MEKNGSGCRRKHVNFTYQDAGLSDGRVTTKDAAMRLLVLVLILRTVTEALQVIGGNVTVTQGRTVVLPCKLIENTEPITQISWQRITRERPKNENFFTVLRKNGPQFVNGDDDRFKFIGSINDSNGSLQLFDVKLLDEGTYTCIFTLFPSGNFNVRIPLNVLVPPISSLEVNHPAVGNEEVFLASCTAASSKPPAEVKWLTGTLEGKVRVTNTSENHANGTSTTVSSLFGIPTKEINNHLVQCVVSSAALSKDETLPFSVQVYFSPMEVHIREIHEKDKTSFECVTEANPHANFTWSRSNNILPQSDVRVEAAVLHIMRMSPDLIGLYQCEASNILGTKQGHLYVHVAQEPSRTCWILFGLFLPLVVLATVWLLWKTGKIQRIWTKREVSQPIHSMTGDQQVQEEEEEEEEEREMRI